MKEVNAEAAVKVGIECFEDSFGVVKEVRENDERSFAFDEWVGFVGSLGERCCVSRGVVFE